MKDGSRFRHTADARLDAACVTKKAEIDAAFRRAFENVGAADIVGIDSLD